MSGHLRRSIGSLDWDLLDPANSGLAGMSHCLLPPTNCDRSRSTYRPSRLGPASPAPDPPPDGQTADCGESVPQSRRSWHQLPSRRESAVPTAGAPPGWSKNSPHDEAANQGPESGTHSVGCAGISRPPRPGQHRPLRAGVSAAQSVASVHRWSLPQAPPSLHDISDDSYPVCLVEAAWRARSRWGLICAGGSGA
jgi:hypothetical protein